MSGRVFRKRQRVGFGCAGVCLWLAANSRKTCQFTLPVYLFICYSETAMPKKSHEAEATELALALSLLVRRLRSTAPSEAHELSWTQRCVMARLESDGPATTAELARAEGVKPQSMGATIASLEELGIVQRKAHATDGRQVNIALTAKGVALRKETGNAKRTWLAEAIEKLAPEEQKRLPAVTDLIKRLAES
jgi:DNA-binding MarR family transcriptional regulator